MKRKVNGKVKKDISEVNECTSEVNECTSEVNECKSEVKEMFKQYLYQREGQVGKFPLEFQ